MKRKHKAKFRRAITKRMILCIEKERTDRAVAVLEQQKAAVLRWAERKCAEIDQDIAALRGEL